MGPRPGGRCRCCGRQAARCKVDPEHQAVQFHPRDLHHLQGDPELGVSYQIMELRDGVPTARELRLDRTTLRTLCPEDL